MLHSNWWCKIRVSLLLCFPFIFNLTIKVSLKVSFSQLVTTVWCENLPNYPKNLLEFGVVSILIKCFCRLSFIQVDSIKVEGIKQRSAGLVLFIQDISSSFIKMLKTCHSIWFNHLKMFSKNCNSHFLCAHNWTNFEIFYHLISMCPIPPQQVDLLQLTTGVLNAWVDFLSFIDSWWQKPMELSIMNEGASKRTGLSETKEGQADSLTSFNQELRLL